MILLPQESYPEINILKPRFFSFSTKCKRKTFLHSLSSPPTKSSCPSAKSRVTQGTGHAGHCPPVPAYQTFMPSPATLFFHLPSQAMLLLNLVLHLAASLASWNTPHVLGFHHGLQHLEDLNILPETQEPGQTKKQQNPQDNRALVFSLTPSNFVILSCKAKAFLVVLSKYGKCLVLSIQRVHLSMVCGV